MCPHLPALGIWGNLRCYEFEEGPKEQTAGLTTKAPGELRQRLPSQENHGHPSPSHSALESNSFMQ